MNNFFLNVYFLRSINFYLHKFILVIKLLKKFFTILYKGLDYKIKLLGYE